MRITQKQQRKYRIIDAVVSVLAIVAAVAALFVVPAVTGDDAESYAFSLLLTFCGIIVAQYMFIALGFLLTEAAPKEKKTQVKLYRLLPVSLVAAGVIAVVLGLWAFMNGIEDALAYVLFGLPFLTGILGVIGMLILIFILIPLVNFLRGLYALIIRRDAATGIAYMTVSGFFLLTAAMTISLLLSARLTSSGPAAWPAAAMAMLGIPNDGYSIINEPLFMVARVLVVIWIASLVYITVAGKQKSFQNPISIKKK